MDQETEYPSDDSDALFPSFASAPPPPPASDTAEQAEGKGHVRKRKKSDEGHRLKKHRHRRHEQKSSGRRRHRGDDGSRSDGEGCRAERDTGAALEELTRERHVAVDRRGDANLRLFGESARPGAPKFKRSRASRNRVLGLGPDATGSLLTIDPASRRDDPVIRLVCGVGGAKEQQPRYYAAADWTAQTDGAEHVTPPVLAETRIQAMADEDYILLDDTQTQADSTAVQAQSKYDDETKDKDGVRGRPDFRSLEGMARPDSSNAVAMDRGTALTGVNSQTGWRDPAATKAVAELEARIRMDKHDVSAWMGLAACQREIAETAFVSGSRRQSRRTIVELQLEVYRRGLEANPRSPELALGYLAQCNEIMDAESLAEEWEKVAGDIDDIGVVMEYVGFCQGTMVPRRSVDWMAGIYARSVERVLCCGVRQDPQTRARASMCATELLHCLCLFLRDAGYLERAVATYQAVLEWYLIPPTEPVDATHGHRLHSFEAFWNSGCRRIGHAGAKGWASFAGDKNEQHTRSPRNGSAEMVRSLFPRMESSSASDDFYSAEVDCMHRCAGTVLEPVSMRDIDPDWINTVDPFAVTIFEDLAPFLVDMEWSEDAAGALVDRFLQFAGVVGPRTFVFTHHISRGTDDTALDELACALPRDSCDATDPPPQLDPLRWTQELPCSLPFVSLPCGLDSIDMPLPYAKYCLWMQPTSRVLQEVAANALELLATAASRLPPDMRLQLCVVLVEWAFVVGSAEDGKQLGKRLLARHPTSLALWNSFAKMHARVGDWDEARRVWSRSLAFAAQLPATEKGKWTIVVRKSWAVLELMHGRGLAVAVRIACAETGSELQALAQKDADNAPCVVFLREDVLRALQWVRKEECALRASSNAEATDAAAALLLWLTYAQTLDMRAVDKAFAELEASEQTRANERLWMELCAVHFFHSSSTSVHRIGDLRRRALSAVEMYPHNVVFWEILLQSEARFRVSSRVRLVLAKASKRSDYQRRPSMQMLFVYVRMRLDRQSSASADVCISSTRVALGKATCGGTGKSSLTWMLGYAFEQQHGSAKTAARVLSSAIRQCPWAKRFFMAAIANGITVGTDDPGGSTKSVLVRQMVACGIRLHTMIKQSHLRTKIT
ncbi:hypothetical protein IWW48_000947 [Coemansia sp. RSA 1200]|nr:hypothetical protein IWW48_000947 [Coemansia sp. RSA 1200]